MPRPFSLTIRASRETGYDLAETLGFDDISEALSVSVFDDGPEHVSVQALYADRPTAEGAAASLGRQYEGHIQETPDEDWVALSQSGLAPIVAGRFAVHGSHDAPPPGATFPILLDAGQAFGTGHHGTTQGCLLLLDQLGCDRWSPETVLDLGTGAGILAIAARKLFPKADILATDIDPVAVDVAAKNGAQNQAPYDTLVADGFDAPDLKGRQFDLIIANILAGPLQGLAPDISGALKPAGYVILSGILDEQADIVAESFERVGLQVTPQPSLDGWTSLLGHKKTPDP
jgi:ribosomal protein L11 methyltransferase